MRLPSRRGTLTEMTSFRAVATLAQYTLDLGKTVRRPSSRASGLRVSVECFSTTPFPSFSWLRFRARRRRRALVRRPGSAFRTCGAKFQIRTPARSVRDVRVTPFAPVVPSLRIRHPSSLVAFLSSRIASPCVARRRARDVGAAPRARV